MWLERERVAQELFKKQQEKEEQAQRDKEEREVHAFLKVCDLEGGHVFLTKNPEGCSPK